MSYVVPQVLINQLISEVSINTVKNQNVLVIGPNYELFRYSDDSEKQKAYVGRWSSVSGAVLDASGQKVSHSVFDVDGNPHAIVDYPGLPSGSVPDASYVKVYADNAVVRLLNGVDSITGDIGDIKVYAADAESGVYNVVEFEDFNLIETTDARNANLPRDISAGDVLYFKYSDGTSESEFMSKILSVEKDSDGQYTRVKLDSGVPAEALSDPASDSEEPPYKELNPVSGSVAFCASLSAKLVPSKTNVKDVYNWSTYSDTRVDDSYGIEFEERLVVDYSNWQTGAESNDLAQYEIISADLYVEYRALLKNNSTTIESVASAPLVESVLGTIHPDNPLAFGAYMALLNSGDRLVYYCGVETDDLSGYLKVLGKAELTDEVYFIVPLTRDSSVITAVKEHVERMSSAENKLWRVGFVANDPPETDEILDKASNPNGNDYYVRFTNTAGANQERRVMTFWRWDAEGQTFVGRDDVKALSVIRPGDKVRVFTGDDEDTWDDTPGYTVYTVQKVYDNYTVLLSEPYSAAGYREDAPTVVEVYRVLGTDEQVNYIRDASSKLATRRMYNVFPTIARGGGVDFGGEFLAAAAAGLASSVLPQQPLTNVALNGIDDIPVVYQTYSKAQLDTIASGGTFIVMQDRPGKQVYVRHQISTEYTSGNLMKSELSVTKNLDSISYYLAETFAPYIGKYNVTPELVDVVENVLRGAIHSLGSDTGAGMYGPQIIAEGTEILYVKQHEIKKDHIVARVRLNLPVPFNYFDLDLEV